MDEAFQIVYVDDPEKSAWGIIGRGVGNYNREQAGDTKFHRLCFALVASDQTIVEGVLGEMHWDWLDIELLWVKDELRRRGYGRRLLTLIEDEARKLGAKHAHLDTFSFQAPDFYKKHGYQVFGELPNYPAGHQRYYLMKQL